MGTTVRKKRNNWLALIKHSINSDGYNHISDTYAGKWLDEKISNQRKFILKP
jgi:hypothetical protein